MSGNYYLSIFNGQQGFTSLTQYTINPSFFGQLLKSSPPSLTEVSFAMKGNDLWLVWNSTSTPELTQIIFSQ
jgi:hypothetical protein